MTKSPFIPTNPAPRLSVRKVKTFKGMDGEGMNAEILLDGKPMAFAVDEGCGGDTFFEWYDRGKTRRPLVPYEAEVTRYIESLNLAPDMELYEEESEVPDTSDYEQTALDCPGGCGSKISVTKQRSKPEDLAAGMREYRSYYCYGCNHGVLVMPMDLVLLVNRLVDIQRVTKQAKRMCAKKTAVVTTDCKDGEVLLFNSPYTPALGEKLRVKYGEKLVEIVNESLAGAA